MTKCVSWFFGLALLAAEGAVWLDHEDVGIPVRAELVLEGALECGSRSAESPKPG